GYHLRICGPLLRRVRLADSHRWFGVHVWLCDAGRNFRVDHRLGFDPRVCLWRRDGGLRMEWVSRQPSRRLRTPHWAEMDCHAGNRAGPLQGALGCDRLAAASACKRGSQPGNASSRSRRFQFGCLLWNSHRDLRSGGGHPGIVILKVAIVLVFIAVAGAFVLRHGSLAAANWHPFIPPNTGKFGEYGLSGVARGAAVIFFAYIGFDAVSTAAQEAKNPQRDMPIGIIGSLVICTILYILVSGLL